MVRLSVNVNKIATLRNARGGNVPDLLQVVRDIESFGAEGITIHPRPDQRHIRYQDARDLKKIVHTELNIEGNPIPEFLELVLEVRPDQVTLVPDAPDAITSNAGWDTLTHRDFLEDVISQCQKAGIRTSIFIDPDPQMIRGALETGTDRVELYTEAYAREYTKSPEKAVKKYTEAARTAHE
ncbi:pyridoxine 5'-phosphate synthase, partial [Robiginitalea sp.]|uniref:pyridoxine 5'-phosphate synthase n=1 Tax=Robiginitalea sp. TaxID=1902411 RepID=UPI003C6B75BB